MPFQNCPGIAQAAVFYTWQGQQCENVFHARKTSPWSTAELQGLADQVADWVTHQWNLNAISSAAMVGLHCVDLSTELGASYQLPVAEPIPGTLALTNVPTSMTAAIKFSTAFRGRSFRGRAYHVGLGLQYVLDSRLTVAAIGALNTCYEYLRVNIDSSAGTMCVLSRVHDKAVRPVGLGFDVTTISVNGAVDSQRRRLPERGI